MWLNWDFGLQAHKYKYFNDLFSSHGCETDLVLSKVRKIFSSSHNEDLLRPFDQREVKSALFSMFGEKSLSPYSLNPGFFQHYWELVKSDVTNFCLSCLNDMCFPDGLNSTAIVLIHKKNNPENLSDLRLIALCNMIYKIMAKMLANRMKGMMNELISTSQSAFVLNMLIIDNILMAFEIGHYLKRKSTGKDGQVALNVDMSKAYDIIEWSFLKEMIIRLSFDIKWVNLVMLCVTMVQYSIV